MTIHLHREIEKLKKRILELGALVEERVSKGVRAVAECDPVLGQELVDSDAEIDGAEVDIEEECLQILALHQPVAIDLRFLIAVLKLNNDLERIGDLAANMGSLARSMSELDPIEIPFDYLEMAKKSQTMLRRSLDALVNLDPAMARQVVAADGEVDEIHRNVYPIVSEKIQRDPEKTPSYISVITFSRILERIADHATNIAEDVIYSVEGEIARHQGE